MATPNGKALLEIGKTIREVADELRPAVASLQRADRRTRRILRVAIVGLIFDMALSIGLTVNAFRTERAIDQANRSELAALVVCEGNNELRKANLDLWIPLLIKPPDPDQPPPTEAEKLAVAEFRAALEKNFAPEEC